MKRLCQLILSAAAIVVIATGCRGIPAAGEKAARQNLDSVARQYRPDEQKPALPELTAGAGLSNFLAYALLNSPQVEAAYNDWVEAVENITVQRSMPDPKLTFQAYIQDDLTSLMPGLMQDLPGPGKLGVAAQVAEAGSHARYFAFETAVLQTAFDLKSAYYNLHFLDDRIRISRQTLVLLENVDVVSRAQNQLGRTTLQDVYRAQMERAQLTNEISNLEDSRRPMLAQFKAALGILPALPDPPVPAAFEGTPLNMAGDDLLATALARNPKLKAAEAEVRQAEASIAMARKSRTPDFTAGLQAEVYEPPFYWPQASMTLPVWRDKIAAQMAAAQAGKRAAEARLTSEQIGLAADFASRSYDYRESTRNLALLENQLIPQARQSLAIARAGYISSQVDFLSFMDAERAVLNYRLQEVDERLRREIALTALSLAIAGVAPAGAPVLAASPGAAPAQPPLKP